MLPWVLLAIATAAILAAGFYMVLLPIQPMHGQVPPLDVQETATAVRLESHVRAIASKPHNLAHYRDLEAAASYIEQQAHALGYQPVAHEFMVEGRPVRNIELVIAPGPDTAASPTLVIGAHYDSPDDSPGANDNATGVAALLEIANLLAAEPAIRGRRLRLVFFVNEELPYGKTEAMGSLRYARALAHTGEPVMGMIALETLGYFTDRDDQQRYPPPFGLFYPKTANFVAFVGLMGARRLVRRSVDAFRAETAFPAIAGVAPSFIDGIDLSDHWSFDKCGFPAMMITDTAPFRNPHYHTLTDLPATVNYEALARISTGLARMIRQLAA